MLSGAGQVVYRGFIRAFSLWVCRYGDTIHSMSSHLIHWHIKNDLGAALICNISTCCYEPSHVPWKAHSHHQSLVNNTAVQYIRLPAYCCDVIFSDVSAAVSITVALTGKKCRTRRVQSLLLPPSAEIDWFGQTKPTSASLRSLALLLNINIYMREDVERAFMSISVRLDSVEEVIEEKASVCLFFFSWSR